MEIFVQYLDELEDLLYAIFSLKERILRMLQLLFILAASLILQSLAIMLALKQPIVAIGIAYVMSFGLLYWYRSARTDGDYSAA